jgi:glycerophosphoryl diester phosphodiesterase
MGKWWESNDARSTFTLAAIPATQLLSGGVGASPWTAGLDVDEFGGSVPRLVAAADCSVWSPAFEDLTNECMAEAQFAWRSLGVVNQPDQMERLVGMGVAGIITDYPDRLRKVLAANYLPLPPAVSIP